MADADLVLDVSGGDSFTDLYGAARFRHVVATKEIALRLGRRLVLLPQTYGPFSSDATRRVAERILDRATLAYARDPESYRRLQELLGKKFDPNRHRQGVDVAFGLVTRTPTVLDNDVASALWDRGDKPLIGINISGLVANKPQSAAQRFSLSCDYLSLTRQLLQRLLDETDARILIVPHVHAPVDHEESDLAASRALLQSLPGSYASAERERIAVVGQPLDACELKWLISRCDWFCGTRMHATIAALSCGVPTAALAYSLKTRGVFETCGAAESVVDMREASAGEALESLLQLWENRSTAAAQISRNLPRVRALAARQLDEIVDCARMGQYSPQAVQC